MGDAHRHRMQARTEKPAIVRLLLTPGLLVAALLFLLIILFLGSSASPTSAMPFTCLRDLFRIKFPCCGYLYEIWNGGFPLSVGRHARLRSLQLYAPVITSQNLLLLANFVVFITLMSMRLRSAAAVRNLKTRKKKKLFELNRSEEHVSQYQLNSVPPLIIDTSDIHGKEDWAATATAARRFVEAHEASTLIESSWSEYAVLKPAVAAHNSLDDVYELNLSTNTGAARLLHASVQMAENTNRVRGDAGVREQVVSAETIVLQNDEGSSFREQRKGSEVADFTGRLPCHKQLQAAHRMSCDCNLCCSTTNSNSVCTHHKKLKSQVHFGRNSISTWQSEQLNSSPQPVSATKSTTFHAQSPAIDPDCKEALLKSKSRVKSIDATNEPTNPDGGQTVNCRTGSHSSTVRDRPCRLRREPSITSQEELNTRVESFISRFNQKIKIQRQQSLISFLQMVNRGS